MCLRQTDIKAVIAYSSISHIRVVSATIAIWRPSSSGTALAMMISHGFTSCALFRIAAVLSDIVGSRRLEHMKGVMRLYPRVGMLFYLALALNGGMPLTIGFFAEANLLGQLVAHNWVLVPVYMLSLFMMGLVSVRLFLDTQHGSMASRSCPSKKVRTREYFMIVIPLMCAVLRLGLGGVLFH